MFGPHFMDTLLIIQQCLMEEHLDFFIENQSEVGSCQMRMDLISLTTQVEAAYTARSLEHEVPFDLEILPCLFNHLFRNAALPMTEVLITAQHMDTVIEELEGHRVLRNR